MSALKTANRINSMIHGLVTENMELEREVFILKNSVNNDGIKTSDEGVSAMIELAGVLLAKQVYDTYSWNYSLKYDEEGVNYEFEEYLDKKLTEFYTDSREQIYKSVGYQDLEMLIRPHLKKLYDRDVNDAKMEYVRSHKEEE